MSTFRSAVRKLTEHLTSDDVGSMKFLCQGAIPTGRLEQVRDALTLFQTLEEHGKLSANNLYFIHSLLDGIGKVHLMRVLTEEGQSIPSPHGPPAHAEPLDYRAILNHIATRLTEQDIKQILYLFQGLNAPHLQETLGKDAREFLLHLERRQIIAPGHLDRLRWGLGEVGRVDLAQFIDECDIFHRQSFGTSIFLGHQNTTPQGNVPRARGPPQAGMLSGQSSSSTPGHAGYAYARDPTASNERVLDPRDYDLPTVGGLGTSVLLTDPQAAPIDISGPIGGLHPLPQLPLNLAPLDERDPVHRPPRELLLWGMPNAPARHPRTVISEETQCWQQHYPGFPEDGRLERQPKAAPVKKPGDYPVAGDLSPAAARAPRVVGSAQRKGPKVVTPASEAPPIDSEVRCRAPEDINAEPPVTGPSVVASSTVLTHSAMQELLQEKTAEVEALRKDRNQFPYGPPGQPLCYEMNSKPHGLAVIISIDEVMFTPGAEAPQPPSSNVAGMDRMSLSLTLQYLGYSVEIYANLTAAEITRKMKTVANRDHMPFDSFICCIIGCGTEQGVYGSDGEVVPLQEVVAALKGNSCPTLIGKPKIFFFQLSQGDTVDEGVQTLAKSLETDTPAGAETVPSEADFFFAYAAVTGYQAYSDNMGSYFIRTLTDVFTEKAQLLHLADMLTEVSQRMAQKAPRGSAGLQLPQVVSRLRKQVWFFN